MKGHCLYFLFTLLLRICVCELFHGGRLLQRPRDFTPPGRRTKPEPIPVPLPLPAQPGYIIIPKAKYGQQGSLPAQNSGNPNHNPPRNGPPRLPIRNVKPNNSLRPQSGQPGQLEKPLNVRQSVLPPFLKNDNKASHGPFNGPIIPHPHSTNNLIPPREPSFLQNVNTAQAFANKPPFPKNIKPNHIHGESSVLISTKLNYGGGDNRPPPHSNPPNVHETPFELPHEDSQEDFPEISHAQLKHQFSEFERPNQFSNQILHVVPEDRKPVFSHQLPDVEIPSSPGHNELPNSQSSEQHSSVEQQHKFPFPDFAEPEPNPLLSPLIHSSASSHSFSGSIVSSSAQELKSSDFSPESKRSEHEVNSAEESVPVSHYGQVLPPGDATYSSEINNFPGLPEIPSNEPWPLPMPEMPKIIHLDAKCEKNLMKVYIDFDKPFHGTIYSKGHFSYGRCVHLPAGSGHNSVQFDISINSCGTQGSSATGVYGPTETGSYFENTLIIQYDPLVQEVWDQARRLRCNWHDQYEKTVTFRPFPVDMLQVVRADFAGDNVGCWMQVQVGKGPWASEVSGIVRIGQTMTMVLAIKDHENRFDMMVRNCIAHDGNRAPIELVDSAGCIMRPKLMSRFTKVKNFGSSASVLAYAHFQAFKFPDSTDVHIQCTVQICRHQCEEQCTSSRRRKRESVDESTEVGLNRIIQVVAPGDLTFSPDPEEGRAIQVTQDEHQQSNSVCMSTSGLAASLILLLSVVVISCILAGFLYLKQKNIDELPMPYDLAVLKSNTTKKSFSDRKTTKCRDPKKY